MFFRKCVVVKTRVIACIHGVLQAYYWPSSFWGGLDCHWITFRRMETLPPQMWRVTLLITVLLLSYSPCVYLQAADPDHRVVQPLRRVWLPQTNSSHALLRQGLGGQMDLVQAGEWTPLGPAINPVRHKHRAGITENTRRTLFTGYVLILESFSDFCFDSGDYCCGKTE